MALQVQEARQVLRKTALVAPWGRQESNGSVNADHGHTTNRQGSTENSEVELSATISRVSESLHGFEGVRAESTGDSMWRIISRTAKLPSG